MTSPHQDPAEDAAFEEFLQGRGELVKQLKAMSQMTPSAALDAAILASAKNAVEQEKRAKQAAANDPDAQRKPGFLPPLRMPMAMAASLMVAVLVTVLWHAQQDARLPDVTTDAPQASAAVPAFEAAGAVASIPTTGAPQSRSALQDAKKQSEAVASGKKPVAALKQPETVAESHAQTSAKKIIEQTPATALPSHAPVMMAAKQAEPKPLSQPLQQPHAEVAPMPSKPPAAQVQPAPTAPAPAANASAAAPVIHNLATEQHKPAVASPSASKVGSAAKAAPQDEQKAWLDRIEALIKSGSSQQAAAEWERFEKANPGYPVPEQLKAQMQALKK